MLFSLDKRANSLSTSTTIPSRMMTFTESLQGLKRNAGIWYHLKHNWRQLLSFAPGLIMLCALGNLHMSWTIWELYKYFYYYQHLDTEILLAWFIGVTSGGLFGIFLSGYSKILIYYSIAMAIIPVSVCFVFHQTLSYNVLLVGRATSGILYGLTLITLITHIADNSSQFMRRHFMSVIAMINLLPTILLAKAISTDVNTSIGVIMFVLAIFTLISMPFTYESIIFLLKNGKDLCALEIMLKLRNEPQNFTRRDFNEFKTMLMEDNTDGSKIFSNSNSRPLLVVLCLRLFNVLLTNSCIYWIFLANIWFDFQHWLEHKQLLTKTKSSAKFVHSAYSYSPPELQMIQFFVIVSLVKIVVGVPLLWLAEKFQVYRNRVIFKLTLCIGCMNLIFFMATIASKWFDSNDLIFTFNIAKLLSVIYCFYLLIAFSIDTIGYSELSESFSLTNRYGCIAIILIGEYLSHAIAILLVVNALYPFYFHAIQSVFICLICFLLLKWMPNGCLNCTLREARDKHFVKMGTSNN